MSGDFRYSKILKPRSFTSSIDAEAVIKFLLFFIWPVGGFLFSLRTPASKSSYIIYFLFGIVFCLNMTFQGGTYIDLVHVSNKFLMQPNMSFSEMCDSVGKFFQGSTEKKELYDMIIFWFTKQFSNNYHVMFAVASIPFSFFMLKSLAAITKQYKFHFCFYCVIVMLLFILPKDIFNVQNFRYATATWISIYSLIQFFKYNKWGYTLLLFLTPFVHSSFYFLVAIFLLYIVITRVNTPETFFKCMLIGSIPFAFLESDFLGTINLSILPENLSSWADYYMTKESRIEFGMSSFANSGLRFLFHILQIACYTWGIFIMLRSVELKNSSKWLKNAFWFYVFFVAITYFVQAVPVLGSRFWGVSRILFIFLWFSIMYPKKNGFLLILLASCFYEIFYECVSHYQRVLDTDFYISSLPTLLSFN